MLDFANGEGPPPPELIEAFRAREWGLPEAGGRLDQPAGLVMRMSYALNVYEHWSGYLRAEAQGRGTQWKNADPQRARFVNDILREDFERQNG